MQTLFSSVVNSQHLRHGDSCGLPEVREMQIMREVQIIC